MSFLIKKEKERTNLNAWVELLIKGLIPKLASFAIVCNGDINAPSYFEA